MNVPKGAIYGFVGKNGSGEAEAFSFGTFAILAGQLTQQCLHLMLHLCKGLLGNAGSGNEYIQTVAHFGQLGAYTFPQAAFGTVAHHGNAHLFAYGKADALLVAANVQQRKVAAGYTLAAAVYVGKLPVRAQTILPLHAANVLSGGRKPPSYRKSPYPLHPLQEMGRAFAIVSFCISCQPCQIRR